MQRERNAQFRLNQGKLEKLTSYSCTINIWS